jgi:hypothetical protein
VKRMLLPRGGRKRNLLAGRSKQPSSYWPRTQNDLTTTQIFLIMPRGDSPLHATRETGYKWPGQG